MQKSWRWKHARCEQQDGKIFCVVKAQEPELILEVILERKVEPKHEELHMLFLEGWIFFC